jgi:glycosyltransferase involved in cell wall biosynthesis
VTRPVRTLLFSTLYPSSARPHHGVFVETRLRELLKHGAVDTRVVAPVPWFPSRAERFGEYARFAATPRREQRHGIDVLHPRYALIPKFGMTLAPFTMALGARRAVQALRDEGFDFDVIDAHYFYPDGVAAALLARRFGRPFCITARGSDVNLIARHAAPRRLMQWAAQQAAACIGVSAALVQAMRDAGLAAQRWLTLRNGVDLQRFRPVPQAEARAALRLSGAPLLLSVGNLIPLKGHDLCIDALARLRATHPGARLVILGAGPERERLLALAASCGVADAVTLAGTVPNDQLSPWYSAADALLLASSREGWPNVLLEAMACGTPVVATGVGGIPEIVRPDSGGVLVAERSAEAIADALAAMFAAGPDRAAVRRYAEGFGWDDTSRAQLRLFQSLLPHAAPEPAHA